jgi:DNA topoisomerase VI subunit B
LRSLTNFNSYIDSISKSKAIEARILKFYVAEKANTKSKKFFSFTVELPEIAHKDLSMSEEQAQKLIDNIVEVLNKKYLESKTFKTKHGKTFEADQPT